MGYMQLYQSIMARDASRALRTEVVHVSLTRDDYLRGMSLKLASEAWQDARDLSMFSYQAATVSRGDDVRPRLLRELGWRILASVGKQLM